MIRFAKFAALAVTASLLSACGGGGGPAIPVATNPTVDGAGSLQPDMVFLAGGAPTHIIRPFRAGISISGVDPTGGSANSSLSYQGGPVQVATKIYVVFWGKSWSTVGDPEKVSPTLLGFYRAIGGHGWIESQTQYTERDGRHAGNPAVMLAGSYVDSLSNPAKDPSDASIGVEAARAARHFKDYSGNASYIVAMPSRISPSGFGSEYCAWHSSEQAGGGTIAFTSLPYTPDQGSHCGAGSVNKPGTLDGVTIIAGVEEAETITDPQLSSGWNSLAGETGDLCRWSSLENNPDAGNYPTQSLWSNAKRACVQNS